jgi:hypothetical protein
MGQVITSYGPMVLCPLKPVLWWRMCIIRGSPLRSATNSLRRQSNTHITDML